MMRKVFREPEVKRIELNLMESIASSAQEEYSGLIGIYEARQMVTGCTLYIVRTEPPLTYEQIVGNEENYKKVFGCLDNPYKAAEVFKIPRR